MREESILPQMAVLKLPKRAEAKLKVNQSCLARPMALLSLVQQTLQEVRRAGEDLSGFGIKSYLVPKR